MRVLPALLLAVSALAGCIQEDAPLDAASTDAAAPAADAAPAPEAGGSAAAPDAPAAPASLALAYEGRTGRWVCAPSGVNSCTGLPGGQGGENSFYEVALPQPSRVEGTLTWTAASPLTQSLSLALLAMTSCGDDCFEGDVLVRIEGASPLTIEAADLDLPTEAALHISVSIPGPDAPGPVHASYSVEQTFAFEGIASRG